MNKKGPIIIIEDDEDDQLLLVETFKELKCPNELMFFQDCTSYPLYPKEQEIDSLQNLGYKFAAFNYLNDPQQLPEYILKDSSILKMDYLLK